MVIKSGQELYVEGVARREREEPDLIITPAQATAIHAAREHAVEGYAVEYGDGITKALEKARDSGRTASFMEFYKGPLSENVLAALLDAGTSRPEPA
ncbi:MAG TPA: hypothetical protein VD706_00610 [Candidatus Saccharimonadales bacterium]|nr:hypothetical protein [Candidatus Saccharimonadales bacterium]